MGLSLLFPRALGGPGTAGRQPVETSLPAKDEAPPSESVSAEFHRRFQRACAQGLGGADRQVMQSKEGVGGGEGGSVWGMSTDPMAEAAVVPTVPSLLLGTQPPGLR